MQLFQYWDSPSVPDDVSQWVAGFRVMNPDMEHVLLDRDMAVMIIAELLSEREVDAFRACAPPAMQADYLRLCLMSALGGVYADADLIPLVPLASLCARAADGLLPQWLTIVSNGILFFPRPHNAYIDHCLRVATDNILGRRFESVLLTSGPGVYNAVWASLESAAAEAMDATLPQSWKDEGWTRLCSHAAAPAAQVGPVAAGFAAITRLTTDELSTWFGSGSPAYKAGDQHWPNWKGSIYN